MYLYLYSPNLKIQAELQIQLFQFRKLRDLTVEAAVGRKHYNYQFGFTSSPFHRFHYKLRKANQDTQRISIFITSFFSARHISSAAIKAYCLYSKQTSQSGKMAFSIKSH